MTAEGGGDEPAILVQLIRIGDKDFEAGDRVRQAKEQLRRLERDKDEAVVVFVHADIEQCYDSVGFDPRHRAEGGGGPLRRNYRDRTANGDPEPARQPIADSHTVVLEIGERALNDMVRDESAPQIL